MAERKPGAPRRSVFADVGYENYAEIIPADEEIFLAKANADAAAGVDHWPTGARPYFHLFFTTTCAVPNVLNGVNIFVEVHTGVGATGWLNYRIIPVWEGLAAGYDYNAAHRNHLYVPARSVRFRACNVSDTNPVTLRGWIKQTGSV